MLTVEYLLLECHCQCNSVVFSKWGFTVKVYDIIYVYIYRQKLGWDLSWNRYTRKDGIGEDPNTCNILPHSGNQIEFISVVFTSNSTNPTSFSLTTHIYVSKSGMCGVSNRERVCRLCDWFSSRALFSLFLFLFVILLIFWCYHHHQQIDKCLYWFFFPRPMTDSSAPRCFLLWSMLCFFSLNLFYY